MEGGDTLDECRVPHPEGTSLPKKDPFVPIFGIVRGSRSTVESSQESMALSPKLQRPFEEAFERLLEAGTASAKPGKLGPSEVSWIEQVHSLASIGLEHAVREAFRGVGAHDSVAVETVMIHGNPFQIEPSGCVTRKVEAGDLLFVGERRSEDGGVAAREALLLQMKVGHPTQSSGDSSAQQALLYGSWPPVSWSSSGLRKLPGEHPRELAPGPSAAAQFGSIPRFGQPGGGGGCSAWPLVGPGAFGGPLPLARLMAEVTRLNIGVDATPDGGNRWPRIVQDILEWSLGKRYGSGQTPRRPNAVEVGEMRRRSLEEGIEPESARGRFLVIIVGTAPPGVLD